MLDQRLCDGVAIVVAGLVAWPAVEPLEGLALAEESAGEATDKILGRKLAEFHAPSQHCVSNGASRYGLNPTRWQVSKCGAVGRKPT